MADVRDHGQSLLRRCVLELIVCERRIIRPRFWTNRDLVLLQMRVQATFRSKATGVNSRPPTDKRPLILALVTGIAAAGFAFALAMGDDIHAGGIFLVQFVPLMAAFITKLVFQRNLRGLGWGWGKTSIWQKPKGWRFSCLWSHWAARWTCLWRLATSARNWASACQRGIGRLVLAKARPTADN